MDAREIRIGDEVAFRAGDHESPTLIVVGIFSSLSEQGKATLYLDFEENTGDVWEIESDEIVKVNGERRG